MAFSSRADLHQRAAAQEALNTLAHSSQNSNSDYIGWPAHSPQLSVSAPLSIPLLGGATYIGRLSGGPFSCAAKLATSPIWHETDMPMQSPHVGCWEINGPGWDAARSLKMTPERTFCSISLGTKAPDDAGALSALRRWKLRSVFHDDRAIRFVSDANGRCLTLCKLRSFTSDASRHNSGGRICPVKGSLR